MIRVNLMIDDDSFHRKLKATAAKNGKSIKAYIIEALQEKFDREEEQERKKSE